MKHVIAGAALALAALPIASCAPAEAPDAQPPAAHGAVMSWSDLFALPKPEPDHRIAYGDGPLQFSELWLPTNDGIPANGHPTVLMIHGGCWQTDIAERDIMNWIAGDLRDNHGIAVWNIEYRGVDRPGGGFPGTYDDVLHAGDSLLRNAERYNLDLSNLVAIGHSAGGHLALWLDMQRNIVGAARSTGVPPVATVISQGGLPDLEAGTRRAGHPCGTEAPRLMLGDRPHHTSPPRMPGGRAARQILVNAARDRIAPSNYAESYRDAQLARDLTNVELVAIPGEGHVELIAPGTASWQRQVELIKQALGIE